MKEITKAQAEALMLSGKSFKVSRFGSGHFHLQRAREAEEAGDYLAARVGYMQCVESFKQAEATAELEESSKEYADFVRRDPFFKKLFAILNAGIKENPGILQSDITRKAEAMNWEELYNHNRTMAKDDIRYVLYFADKFGYITRKKKGRSYELYSNGDPPGLQETAGKIPENNVSEPVKTTGYDRQGEEQEEKSEKNKRTLYVAIVVSALLIFIILKVVVI